jgi:hypothetical protein
VRDGAQCAHEFCRRTERATVTFTWASGGGCPVTNYTIQAGSGPGLSNIAAVNVGNTLSFSATAPSGVYHLRVIAQNSFGSSDPSNQITLTIGGSTAPLGPLAGTVVANGSRLSSVTMPATGRYEATLTWSDPTIDLDLYLIHLASPICLILPTTCVVASSVQTVGNVERVSWPVRADERYALIIDNFSNQPMSYAIQHFIVTP